MGFLKRLVGIDRIVGGPYRGGVLPTYWAQVTPEEGNNYDANAVALLIYGELAGYLSRSDAKRYRPVLEDLQRARMGGFVRCDTWYGWYRGRNDVGNYSLRIYMDTPQRQASLPSKEGIATAPTMSPARERSPRPGPTSARATWHNGGYPQMDCQGHIGDLLVAEIEEAYDPERWVRHIRVPAGCSNRHYTRRLKDAKVEIEQQQADWQP